MNNNEQSTDTTIVSSLDNNTTVISSSEQFSQELIDKSLSTYNLNNTNHINSVYLNEQSYSNTSIIKDSEIELLAQMPQNDINKVLKINTYAKYFINIDDLIGKVYETLESNINTNYRLSYKSFKKKKDQKTLVYTEEIIDNFNDQIDLEMVIKKSIPQTYIEGNYPMYLRNNGDNYVVDYYPLGVVEVSNYEIDNEPFLLMNMNKLKSKLKKINIKNKDGTYLFFKNTQEEISKTYPNEVFEGYIKKNSFVKLDINRTGILRINNMNRKYGVTPIFRTFKPALMLDTFEQADKINAKAKSKKILFQKLRKELLGENGERKALDQAIYSQQQLLQAWKNNTVLYTGAGWVEDLKFVEPKVENVKIEKVNYYRNKIMTNLGISFLNSDNKSAYASAQISIKEMMKVINNITKQLEKILRKWYKVVLLQHNIPLKFCPKITVLDSELLEMELRIQLADVIFNKLGASYQTTYKMLGVDYDNEKRLRQKENNEKVDENIFYPRMTNYTYSVKSKEDYDNENNKGGRPDDTTNVNKQQEDKDRNKAKEGI